MTNNVKLPVGVTFFERGWLSSNNVLLHDSQQAILVDTGYCSHAKQTEELIQSVLGSRPLDFILNTHLHSDHCGGNARLQAIYPDVQTKIPPGNFDHVTHWNPEALTYIPTGQYCPEFIAHSCLKSGDVFEVAGRHWRVYAAPGHDPHSIILFSLEDSILISADALWEKGFGVVFPEIEGLSAFDEVATTLELIESLQPRVVLPGHGAAFTDVSTSISFARARLNSFSSNPEKHALYAAKVLLKFKLLELQTVDVTDFCEWANSCSYLHHLHGKFSQQSFAHWTYEICDALIASGAAKRIGNQLINR